MLKIITGNFAWLKTITKFASYSKRKERPNIRKKGDKTIKTNNTNKIRSDEKVY